MYDLASSSWKTSQGSLLGEGSQTFSGTWPHSGSMLSGQCYARLTLERPISGDWFSFLATPTTQANQHYPSMQKWPSCRRWPTPTASMVTQGDQEHSKVPFAKREPYKSTGPLSPLWTEWLMGFPMRWTDCEPSAMPSSPSKPPKPSGSSGAE